MSKLMLENMEVSSKCVLLRVDFNVPIENGKIIDDKRLRAVIPTILHLIKNRARIVIISHLGRPVGNKTKKFSLKPCAKFLSDLLGINIIFLNDCIGDEVKEVVNNLNDGQVVLLENLRFYQEEVQNDAIFAKELSKFADLYVNDAFGTVHRSHASTVGVTNFIKNCGMGFLIRKEISCINSFIKNPERIYLAIIGGSKIADKIEIISNLLKKVDKLILGGAVSYTFLKAKGLEIGESLFEPEKVNFATKLLEEFQDKLLLPEDCLVTDSFDYQAKTVGTLNYVKTDSIKKGWYGIDIGRETILKYSKIINSAKTIIWNGPLGIFEVNMASHGTFAIAEAVGKSTKNGAKTVIGGGDSALAIERAGVIDNISHISTGGGASLSFIGEVELPGITALTDVY